MFDPMPPGGLYRALHLFKWSLSDIIILRLFNDLSLIQINILTKYLAFSPELK
jgi:hypothetical protein